MRSYGIPNPELLCSTANVCRLFELDPELRMFQHLRQFAHSRSQQYVQSPKLTELIQDSAISTAPKPNVGLLSNYFGRCVCVRLQIGDVVTTFT